MAKTWWPAPRKPFSVAISLQRFAQRSERAQASAVASRSQGQGGHSSITIAMSLPRLAWMVMTSFGPRKSFLPSRWL